MLSEGIGVDAGVDGRCDGPFRGCVVGLQPVVEAYVVSEGEQRLIRDGVDRVRGSQPAEIYRRPGLQTSNSYWRDAAARCAMVRAVPLVRGILGISASTCLPAPEGRGSV
jgi:hypothetical protein